MPAGSVRICADLYRAAAIAALAGGVAIAGCGGGDGSLPQRQPGVYETTTIATFREGGSSSLIPGGDLTRDAAGNLYGTAEADLSGAHQQVYRIDASSHAVTTIGTAESEGLLHNLLADKDGNVFGWEIVGNQEHIFKIPRGSSTLTILATIDQSQDTGLNNPRIKMILDGQGNLYGTIVAVPQSALDDQTVSKVFEIPQGTTAFQTLASFPRGDARVSLGTNIAIDDQGNVFGTTYSTDLIQGTVWEVAHGSNTVTTLASLPNNGTGSGFQDLILLDSAGNLYGAATGTGLRTQAPSTIYEVPRSGGGYGALQTIGTFPGYPILGVISNLALDHNGNVYGIRSGDNSSAQLKVFKVDRGSRQATDLASVEANLAPIASVQIDDSGNVFGTVISSFGEVTQSVFEVVKGSGTAIPLVTLGTAPAYSARNFLMDSDGDIFAFVVDDTTTGSAHVVQLSPVSRSVKSRSVSAGSTAPANSHSAPASARS